MSFIAISEVILSESQRGRRFVDDVFAEAYRRVQEKIRAHGWSPLSFDEKAMIYEEMRTIDRERSAVRVQMAIKTDGLGPAIRR